MAKKIHRRPLPGRNKPCPCGSGKKFKTCCWKKTRQPTVYQHVKTLADYGRRRLAELAARAEQERVHAAMESLGADPLLKTSGDEVLVSHADDDPPSKSKAVQEDEFSDGLFMYGKNYCSPIFVSTASIPRARISGLLHYDDQGACRHLAIRNGCRDFREHRLEDGNPVHWDGHQFVIVENDRVAILVSPDGKLGRKMTLDEYNDQASRAEQERVHGTLVCRAAPVMASLGADPLLKTCGDEILVPQADDDPPRAPDAAGP